MKSRGIIVKQNRDWFETIWHYRENVLYPNYLGGGTDSSIITIPHVAFSQMGFEQVDPRWLHCGLLAFPPVAKRGCFTFVTSGLSNAWDDSAPDPTAVSGLGIELRIDNPSDEHWVKDVLLRLSAMQLLIGAGRITGARVLGDGDRVRVGAETFGDRSAMTSLLASEVADFHLASGTFEVMQLFAITDSEFEFARAEGAEALLSVLRLNTTYPINDIARGSLV